jgi:uroporphyrin-III C-methyltransferase/precorrin-2 dehydrogenase/sirohydrochlorin ferrochelatase/uroporphyrin-III C-methyltransferase
MSGDHSDEIGSNLLQHGVKQDRFIAVIEQATTPLQKVFSCPLNEYASRSRRDYVSPTIIIIGKVAGLHNQFRWKPDSESDELYFKPIKKTQHQEERA